ncbi:hypothetical protein D9M72_500330 [compost metagenome]
MDRVVTLGIREVRRHVGGQRVAGGVGRSHKDHGHNNGPPVGLDNAHRALGSSVGGLGSVLAEFFLRVQGGLELRGFLDLAPEVDRDEAQGTGEQERDAPAPLFHRSLAHGQLQG